MFRMTTYLQIQEPGIYPKLCKVKYVSGNSLCQAQWRIVNFDFDTAVVRTLDVSVLYTHAYCSIAAKGWIEEYTKYTNTQYTE